MECQRCKSSRIFAIFTKCSDDCNIRRFPDRRYSDGYVPEGPLSGECGSDYMEFEVCAECGQMQGEFPATDAQFGFEEEM